MKNGKRVIIKQTFDIADDGANATINSWNVDWKDTTVEVVIFGTEQDAVLYVILVNRTVAVTDSVAVSFSFICNDNLPLIIQRELRIRNNG